MIGGVIVGSNTGMTARVVVRAIGPSLIDLGVAGALQDPRLELFDGNGVMIQANDNWKDSQQAEIEETGLAPSDDRESAIVRDLAPGAYTAITRGVGDTTGGGIGGSLRHSLSASRFLEDCLTTSPSYRRRFEETLGRNSSKQPWQFASWRGNRASTGTLAERLQPKATKPPRSVRKLTGQKDFRAARFPSARPKPDPSLDVRDQGDFSPSFPAMPYERARAARRWRQPVAGRAARCRRSLAFARDKAPRHSRPQERTSS